MLKERMQRILLFNCAKLSHIFAKVTNQKNLTKDEITEMTKYIKYFQTVTSIVNDNEEVDTEMKTGLSECGLVHTPATKEGNCFSIQ